MDFYYELKIEHVLSIPICALLSDTSTDLFTPWFTSPEFSAQGLAVRCRLFDWSCRRREGALVAICHSDVATLNNIKKAATKGIRSKSSTIDGVMASSVNLKLNYFGGLPFLKQCRSFETTNEGLATPSAVSFRLDKPLERSVVGARAASESLMDKPLLVTVGVTLIMRKEEPSSPSLPACPAQLSANDTLQRMLSEGLLPDVQLQLQGGALPAHRAVLAACSPVFRAMFQHNMKESQSGQVDMPDVPLAAMEAALQLLYGGDLSSQDPELWMQVLALADCYQLAALKALCEATLCARVPDPEEPSELLRLLVLADQHSAPDLRSAILSRFSTCMRGKELDEVSLSLMKNHPSLAKHLVEFLLK